MVGTNTVAVVLALAVGLAAVPFFVMRRRVLCIGEMDFYRAIDFMGLLQYRAGELTPSRWELIESIASKFDGGKCEIIAGPLVLIYPNLADLIDEHGRLEDPSRFWELNPVFKFLKNHPDKIRVYIQTAEMACLGTHFGIAVNADQVIIEDPHSKGEFETARILKDKVSARRMIDRFAEMKAAPGVLEVVEENIPNLLKQMVFRPQDDFEERLANQSKVADSHTTTVA